jgi:hypothetical protein
MIDYRVADGLVLSLKKDREVASAITAGSAQKLYFWKMVSRSCQCKASNDWTAGRLQTSVDN